MARAYDSFPVGICYFDKDGRYVHINRWLAELNGLPVAEHLGRTVEELMPRVSQSFVDSIRCVLETGIQIVQSVGVGESLGSVGQPSVGQAFEQNFYPDRAEDGTVIGVSCFVEKVTDRRQIETTLGLIAERYRSVLETIPHGIEHIDLDGKILFANAALHRLYRCDPGELIGRSFYDFVEENERDSMRAYIANLIEEQPQPSSHETQALTKDAELIDIRADWDYRFDSNHQLIGFTSIITDRTSDVHLHELELLYRHAPVGLCFVDRDLRFQRINDRMAEINGKSVEENIGATLEEAIPDIADQVVPVYRRVLRTGQPVVNLEVRGRLPSDPYAEHVWVMNHHAVKANDDSILGVSTVVQEITHLKRVEQELREATRLLADGQRITNTGSWAWDLIDGRVRWSQELYRIFGYDRHPEPTFEAFLAHIHPDDTGRIRHQFDAVFERNEPFAVEFRIIRTDATERVIQAHAKLVRTEDGTPLRLFGSAQVVPPRSEAAALDEH